MAASLKDSNVGLVRIRSNQSLLDGLVGKAQLITADHLIDLTLTEESPQADLEIGDMILIPLASITFIYKIGKT